MSNSESGQPIWGHLTDTDESHPAEANAGVARNRLLLRVLVVSTGFAIGVGVTALLVGVAVEVDEGVSVDVGTNEGISVIVGNGDDIEIQIGTINPQASRIISNSGIGI